MELIDKVIGALSDGSLHDFSELSTGLRNLSMTKLMLILNFLAEYNFIELSQVGEGEPLKVKLRPNVQEFLREMKEVERLGGK